MQPAYTKHTVAHFHVLLSKKLPDGKRFDTIDQVHEQQASFRERIPRCLGVNWAYLLRNGHIWYFLSVTLLQL